MPQRFSIKTSFLIFALFITLHSTLIPLATAQTSTPSANLDTLSIGYSRLSPENPLYFLKAVREVLEIKFAGTEKVRILRRLEFAERRLREINSLTVAHREDLVQPNIERFLMEIEKIGSVNEDPLHLVISQSLGHYMQSLVALYNNLADPKAKLGIRRGIYALINYAARYYKSQKPLLRKELFPPQATKLISGCQVLTQEAFSSALSESERQVLLERGERCREVLTALMKNDPQ